VLVALGGLALHSPAAVPAPEKLLPDDTLVMVTAPDFAKLRDTWSKSSQSQFLNDPSMKPFRDKFLAKWREEFVKPIEHDLNVNFDQYLEMLQGQVTLAMTMNGSQGKEGEAPGFLLLMDAREKSSQLKTNLAEMRKQWVDSGKSVRSEKMAGFDFSVLSFGTNDVPKVLRRVFPPPLEVHELGEDTAPKKPLPRSEVVVGQADSLLIVGNSMKVVERLLGRLTGSASSLADVAQFQANYTVQFHDAPAFAWINAKVFLDLASRAPEKKDSAAPDPFDGIKPEQVLGAIGLGGIKSIAFSLQNPADGMVLQAFVGAPEASRQGLLKVLAGEAKESNPPPFVPADAIKFQRWRLDGQKAWAAIEKLLRDISPQSLNGLNLILETANSAAKTKDADFDLKKNLIGNLGDDMITYEKAPRGPSRAEQESPPYVFLIGSPKAEQLAAAMGSIMIFISPEVSAPAEREFLGRKIYSVPRPTVALPMIGDTKPAPPGTLSYAASGGYLAFSTDTAALEEFLRSSENQGKALRETAGLMEAAQNVTGPGTSLFGYENQVETMRASFADLRKSTGPPKDIPGSTLGLLAGMLGATGAEQTVREWMDFSLLPPFEQVAKYFSFTVYGGRATADGLTYRYFAPQPQRARAPAPVSASGTNAPTASASTAAPSQVTPAPQK
jgi:hypothetical protein